MAATSVDVPESQRLIAVSLGKIAASRGQKGGINLHKNLLVATVLHKARTAYMIQHFAARQRVTTPQPPTTTTQVAASPSSPVESQSHSLSPSNNVEMKEEQASEVSVSEPMTTSTSSSSSSSPASSPTSTTTTSTAAPTFPAAPLSTHSASVAPSVSQSGSLPDGAAVSSVQVAANEDKENTPPPSPTPSPQLGDAATQCEKRLHGDKKDSTKDSSENGITNNNAPFSPRVGVSQKSTRDYVSKSGSNCLLKRRRAMNSDHENVSAPKVRIVHTPLCPQQQDSNPEPMQCDSPQISNLVNIFNTSFSGLSSHKLSVVSVSDSTCAKEMNMGLDSVRQPLVLSV